jgi:ribosomal protein S18 acetylase RimI-like enzyme
VSRDAREGGASPAFVPIETLDSIEADAIAGRLARMDPWLTLGYGGRLLSAYLRDDKPDRLLYLIKSAEETLGLAVIRYPWLRGAYIELLAVFPECQGRGLGSAALRFVETRFKGQAANLWLLVSSFNADAQRFYERSGFRAIGTIEDFVVAGKDEILMRKRL